MNPKDPEAKKLLAVYTAKPIEIKRTQKDNTVLTSITKEVIYDNIQLPAIFMGYKFPEQLNTDSYAIEMLNEVLSGGSSSRINKTIVEKKKWQLLLSHFITA